MVEPGWVVILNGAPRSGKSSIARAMQNVLNGVWINLGVDVMMDTLPARLRPGIGLRPGGERPEVEAVVPTLYAALYESVAAHSRQGLNVVVDVGHHDAYSRPLDILNDRDRRLIGLPVLKVGVICPIGEIMARRDQSQSGREGRYVRASAGDPVPAPVRHWQSAVHNAGGYDLEVDTSLLKPDECARAIGARLEAGGELSCET